MIAEDLELLTLALEKQTEPLSKSIVLASAVGDYIRRKGISTSNERIGRLLCAPPFNGVPRKITREGLQFRCIVFKKHWLSATAKEILAYMNDPILM